MVWVSPDKHASYLDVALCSHGCGADRCEAMTPLPKGRVINLGEVDRPMNDAAFVASTLWPLAAKMKLTNFGEAALERAGRLPPNEIALYRAGRHPVQGVIAISASTEQAIAGSESNTAGAVGLAGNKTTGAVGSAGGKTGNALERSYRGTTQALGASARKVVEALGTKSKSQAPKE